MIPFSPWIGSTRMAAVFGPIARSMAPRSPYGRIWNPGVNGPNPSRYWASSEKLTTVVVRPWKFPANVRISALPSGIPLTLYPHFREALIAVSTASAPEFIGSIRRYPDRSDSSL